MIWLFYARVWKVHNLISSQGGPVWWHVQPITKRTHIIEVRLIFVILVDLTFVLYHCLQAREPVTDLWRNNGRASPKE